MCFQHDTARLLIKQVGLVRFETNELLQPAGVTALRCSYLPPPVDLNLFSPVHGDTVRYEESLWGPLTRDVLSTFFTGVVS